MNLIGLTANNYKFLSVVGAGSFGTVYKVEKRRSTICSKSFFRCIFSL